MQLILVKRGGLCTLPFSTCAVLERLASWNKLMPAKFTMLKYLLFKIPLYRIVEM